MYIFLSETGRHVDWHIATNSSNKLFVFIFEEDQKLLPFRVVHWNNLRLGAAIPLEASLNTFQSVWQHHRSWNV
jgi:hypothetical protein